MPLFADDATSAAGPFGLAVAVIAVGIQVYGWIANARSRRRKADAEAAEAEAAAGAAEAAAAETPIEQWRTIVRDLRSELKKHGAEIERLKSKHAECEARAAAQERQVGDLTAELGRVTAVLRANGLAAAPRSEG